MDTKIVRLWDAIKRYNHPNQKVADEAQNFLMDHFFWELVEDYTESTGDEYDGREPNGKFIQWSFDRLNDLFQK